MIDVVLSSITADESISEHEKQRIAKKKSSNSLDHAVLLDLYAAQTEAKVSLQFHGSCMLHDVD